MGGKKIRFYTFGKPVFASASRWQSNLKLLKIIIITKHQHCVVVKSVVVLEISLGLGPEITFLMVSVLSQTGELWVFEPDRAKLSQHYND